MRKTITITVFALIPEARAAAGLAPVTRKSKPSEERSSNHQAKTTTAAATKIPQLTRSPDLVPKRGARMA
jgi:hypothetical protein